MMSIRVFSLNWEVKRSFEKGDPRSVFRYLCSNEERPENLRPEWDFNPNLFDVSAELNHLSYQAYSSNFTCGQA